MNDEKNRTIRTNALFLETINYDETDYKIL